MTDLRFALRMLRRSPVVSSVAILSLALGIGANTAIFSVVNALLLRPLPVVEPQRLVTVSSGYALGYGYKAGAGMSYAMWNRMKDRLAGFDNGFAWASRRVNLSPRGEILPGEALFASAGFFSTFGVSPLLGRTFTAMDDVVGGGRDGLITVIGHGLWQRRFAGDPAAIGAVLPIDGVPFTVVGVMPPDFFGVEVGQPFDVAIPLALEPALGTARSSLHDPKAFALTVMLRLEAGQSLDAATAALRAQQPEIVGTDRVPKLLNEPYVLVPAATGTSDRSGLRRRYARPLLTLLAVVVVVLLVACVNIANLLLARAAARRPEMSVRIALGASRWRLARLLLMESVVLALAGALLGLVFAIWASRTIVATLATSDSRVLLDLTLDWRVLAMTATASMATALLCGIAPAIRAGRVAPAGALTSLGRGSDGRSHSAGWLVTGQVALSVVLVAAAGLFVTTFSRITTAPLGFDRDRVLVVDVDLARSPSPSANGAALDVQRGLLDAVTAIPGVAHAAASTITPFSRATKSPLFSEPGRVHEFAVAGDYFDVYGIGITAGRRFDPRDIAGSLRVAVVSEAYAARFFPKESPLGRTIESGTVCDARRTGACTVVGVSRDVVFSTPRGGVRPTIYVPQAQARREGLPGQTMVSLSIRPAAGSPTQVALPVAQALKAFDADLSFSYRTVEQDVHDTLIQERLVARLSGFFAALALLLSGVGLYGLAAYTVTRRKVECGIRLALGATRVAVVRIVLLRILLLVACGLVLGVIMSAWLSQFVAPLLFDLDSRDPAMLGGAVVATAALAALASGAPALRASFIDPAEVLRQN